MIGIKKSMSIDARQASEKIEAFIRSTLTELFKRKGIVVGMSGGIDSAVAASLCVRALGTERVYGLLLPERDSSPVSRDYGRLMAESLGISYQEVELTSILESFDVYSKREAIVRKAFPHVSGDYKFRLVLPQDLLDTNRLNVYRLEVQLEDGTILTERLAYRDYLELMAANDIKQRVRMIELYYEAERRGYIVCGTTNRSELDQGFFVKYGDGGVDIEPLSSLYKTQIYQLAEHIGVPREIITRSPSPDTYSFEVSDKDFYFCLSYDILDMLLYGMENNLPMEEVARETKLDVKQIERAWRDFARKRDATRHLRMLPPLPEL